MVRKVPATARSGCNKTLAEFPLTDSECCAIRLDWRSTRSNIIQVSRRWKRPVRLVSYIVGTSDKITADEVLARYRNPGTSK